MSRLEWLGDDILVVDGPVAIDLVVVPYTTRMTIVRLGNGDLWVASPVKSSFEALAEITDLGPVRHLVSPTPRHYWRLEPWHQLFPEAQLWTSRTSIFTLGRPTLPTATLGDEPPAAWADDLDQASLHGALGFNEVVFLHRATGTLLVEDLLQSHLHHPGKPLVNAIVRFGGLSDPGGVARDIRAAIRDKDAARAWAERVLSWDFDRLIMAHGPVILAGAKGYVEQSFEWLLG